MDACTTWLRGMLRLDDGVGDRLTGMHPRFADASTGW